MIEIEGEQENGLIHKAQNWSQEHPWKFLSFLILFALIILIVYWAIWSDISPEWTGFGKYEVTIIESANERKIIERHKTLWDWMGLLIVPMSLAFGAFWLNLSQKKTELNLAKQQREQDRNLASERYLQDRSIANDKQQQSSLEGYYDRMSDLLLNHKLLESNTGDAKEHVGPSIAIAWTLTTLQNLDKDRKKHILLFLYKANLINKGQNIVSLVGADLKGVNLTQSELKEVNLEEAIMTNANLSWADITSSEMGGVNLGNANLRRATMTKVVLDAARLYNADFRSSQLTGVSFWGAHMRNAKLTNATVTGADFTEADLRNANLRGLKGYNDQQLLQANSLEGAIMPDGRKYEDWKADPEKPIWN